MKAAERPVVHGLTVPEEPPQLTYRPGDASRPYPRTADISSLVTFLESSSGRDPSVLEHCFAFVCPQLAPVLARYAARRPTARPAVERWLRRHRLVAVRGLIPIAVGPDSAEQRACAGALRELDKTHPGVVLAAAESSFPTAIGALAALLDTTTVTSPSPDASAGTPAKAAGDDRASAIALMQQIERWRDEGKKARMVRGITELAAMPADAGLPLLALLGRDARYDVSHKARWLFGGVARDWGLSFDDLEDMVAPKLEEEGWAPLGERIALHQAHRLERAMIAGRRFPATSFARAIEHPLLRALYGGLVWSAELDARPRCFTIGARGLVDEAGGEMRSAPSEVFLPHPATFPDDDAVEPLRRIARDRCLSPPFPQLTRPVVRLWGSERADTRTRRFEGRQAPGSVVKEALAAAGWEPSGQPLGPVRELRFDCPPYGLVICVDPGMPWHRPGSRVRTISHVQVIGGATLGDIDPRLLSEALAPFLSFTP